MAGQAHESAAKIAHYLQGLKLPASKSDLKAEAKKHNVPSDVLKLIDALPEKSFQSMPDIMQAFGQVERKH